MTYEILKFLHVMGAITLMGTGAGIAFFMVMAQQTRDPAVIAHVAGSVVIADTIFTATAAIAQPITGALLIWHLGYSFADLWIALSLALYVFVGIFWVPVVWIQIQLRDIAREAAFQHHPLPDRFHKLYRIWFAFGFPAFTAMLAIIWLMLFKPV